MPCVQGPHRQGQRPSRTPRLPFRPPPVPPLSLPLGPAWPCPAQCSKWGWEAPHAFSLLLQEAGTEA